MKFSLPAGLAAMTLALAAGPALADGHVYGPFPVTVKGYGGDATDSTVYTGQMARHVLHESLKKLAGKGDGTPDAELKARMMAYYKGKEAGRAIVAPKSKGAFVLAQTEVDAVGKKANLADKTFKGAVAGWPGGRTGPEVVSFWIDKASSARKGLDAENGYNYPQLISKFLMGAVFYNQAVDKYLDENLNADVKPNDKPYKKGTAYTGKEHSWDEGFGYFGAAAHTMALSASESYQIAKLGSKSDSPEAALALADHDKDGKVDLGREMTFAHAYYAAGYDKGGKSDYLKTIMKAFIEGRTLIAKANGEALTDDQRAELKRQAGIIRSNWEKVIAESVFKYAGSTYKDLKKLTEIKAAGGDTTKQFAKYAKHWGELKGFALALQAGGKDLGIVAVRLNRLIGYGPVLLDGSQVNFIDGKGNYVRGEAPSLDEYMVHMLKVQKVIADNFGVTARVNDATGDLSELAKKFNAADSAETD